MQLKTRSSKHTEPFIVFIVAKSICKWVIEDFIIKLFLAADLLCFLELLLPFHLL